MASNLKDLKDSPSLIENLINTLNDNNPKVDKPEENKPEENKPKVNKSNKPNKPNNKKSKKKNKIQDVHNINKPNKIYENSPHDDTDTNNFDSLLSSNLDYEALCEALKNSEVYDKNKEANIVFLKNKEAKESTPVIPASRPQSSFKISKSDISMLLKRFFSETKSLTEKIVALNCLENIHKDKDGNVDYLIAHSCVNFFIEQKNDLIKSSHVDNQDTKESEMKDLQGICPFIECKLPPDDIDRVYCKTCWKKHLSLAPTYKTVKK